MIVFVEPMIKQGLVHCSICNSSLGWSSTDDRGRNFHRGIIKYKFCPECGERFDEDSLEMEIPRDKKKLQGLLREYLPKIYKCMKNED